MLGSTPASTAASALDAPRAIAVQNQTRCSRRPAGGRPMPRVPAAAARSRAEFLLGIATPQVKRCDDQLNPPHHRRVIRRPAAPVDAISGIERVEVHLRDRVDDKPRQMPRRQPLADVGRHQERLLTVASDEALSHPGRLLNPPDRTPTYATATGAYPRDGMDVPRTRTLGLLSVVTPMHDEE